jgi:hypothetical protein
MNSRVTTNRISNGSDRNRGVGRARPTRVSRLRQAAINRKLCDVIDSLRKLLGRAMRLLPDPIAAIDACPTEQWPAALVEV